MVQKEKAGWLNKNEKLIQKCRRCKSIEISKYGKSISSSGKKQRYQCQKCGYVWRENKKCQQD